MKKRWMRMLCAVLSACLVCGSTVTATAQEVSTDNADASAVSELSEVVTDVLQNAESAAKDALQNAESAAKDTEQNTADSNAQISDAVNDTLKESVSETGNTQNNSDTSADVSEKEQADQTSDNKGTNQDVSGSVTQSEEKDVEGSVTIDDADVSGLVTVETDKNDDKVEIKKHDKPYLALGADLTAEQQAVVLKLMGIDASKLSDYDVLYVNNSEEHQYLDSYIDSSKIGTRSLSSIVIVEREKGNGINISTNNISYCTVGMYKNALATAGIQDADIIVAGPTAISGTAALVGIFKAYKEMTGEEIDEESIDTALHELVLTGNLESITDANPDEVEAMIAYVKQAVVEHDMSDSAEIREAINEGCEKFGVVLNENEIQQVIDLMLKINELDLDIDELLNSAQSIYDQFVSNGGDASGFFAKMADWLEGLLEKIMNIFS